MHKLLERESTWVAAGRGTVEDLAVQITSCLPDRSSEGSLTAGRAIAAGLLEFAIRDLEPEWFRQVLFARLDRMQADQASALDQAILGVHADLAALLALHDVAEADRFAGVTGQLARVLDRLPPGSADHDEAGSGKTWLARRTARLCAETALQALAAGAALEEVELPLYTTCARLSEAPPAEGIRRAVVASALGRLPDLGGSRVSEALKVLFEARNAPTLLVADSLDEDRGADDRIRQADTLHPAWRIVLTSRPASWNRQLAISDDDPSRRVGVLQPLRYPDDIDGRVVAGFCEHPGAEDRSQAGPGGDDLSVRVLPARTSRRRRAWRPGPRTTRASLRTSSGRSRWPRRRCARSVSAISAYVTTATSRASSCRSQIWPGPSPTAPHGRPLRRRRGRVPFQHRRSRRTPVRCLHPAAGAGRT